ncbi:MAG TPA: ABC-F family ATP-binding cassette domain-containing protein [Acidimicrobiia bacterium]|nr:ABC-F family ATP-binding cassette domain-containing protein [Acidimicrobiia bacterium]
MSSFMSARHSLASLVARDLVKSFGSHVVLESVDVTVGPGSRLGVVAPNGTGKTTLLAILAGVESPDAGRVTRTPPDATVGYLPQEADRRAGETVRAYLARRTGVAAAERALDHAAHALADGSPGAPDTYARALDAYLALGAPDLDARIGAVLADLGLAPRILDVEMSALSGGQAARASLAAILLSQFDVFLLDEPTNNLDFGGLDRLERFLHDDLAGGAVIVSHDRAFLDRTVDRVLELDEHTHTATEYAGGWAAYLAERATARRHAEEDYATFVAQRDTLVARAREQRQWSVRGTAKVAKSGETDKYIRQFKRNSSEHVAAKAKITDKALERLEANAIAKPWQSWDLRMDIAAAPRGGAVVARLSGAVVTRGSFTLGPIDLEIRYGERVALLGANGSGKTTLLDAILGRLTITAGDVQVGPGVIVGELDQARAAFAGPDALLPRFETASGLRQREARALLAKFGLTSDHVTRAADSLSPGERTRASLALLSAGGVNCLVLDEPTNHLDLPAIEQLEQALDGFAGTVVLVTHDRALLDAVRLTRCIELVDGSVVSDGAPAVTGQRLA